jgi:heme exporter protein B
MMLKLTLFEFKSAAKSHQILRSSAYMMLLSLILFSIIVPADILNMEIKLLICFSGLIFTSMIVPPYLIKSDLNDGFLETILTIYSPSQIVIAKYLALVLNLILSCLIILPIIILIFQIPYFELIYLYTLMALTIMQLSIMLVFVNILHAYFKRNTNLLISLILPLILPSLMIASMALSSLKIDFLMILLGIDLIFVPLTFCLSSYLLKNLFNF